MDKKIENPEQRRTILIAEDDEAILEVIKTILDTAGYELLTPNNVQEIYEFARQKQPSLMLLDIWLRGHDGGKVAKDLKENKQTQQIPIILMSANNETEKIAREVKAEGFLLKPFTIDELLAIIKKHTR